MKQCPLIVLCPRSIFCKENNHMTSPVQGVRGCLLAVVQRNSPAWIQPRPGNQQGKKKFSRLSWLRFSRKGHKRCFAQEFCLESLFKAPPLFFWLMDSPGICSFSIVRPFKGVMVKPVSKLRSGYYISASFVCKYLSTCLTSRCADREDTALSKNICGFCPRGASWTVGETAINQRTGEIKINLELGGASWRLCIRNFWESSKRI